MPVGVVVLVLVVNVVGLLVLVVVLCLLKVGPVLAQDCQSWICVETQLKLGGDLIGIERTVWR